MKKIRAIYQKLPVNIQSRIVKFIAIANIFKTKVYTFIYPIKSKFYKSDLIEEYNKNRQFGPQQVLCYAPFSSMFFSVFGKVAPCYASYYKINANYPDESISDIWNGDEFKKIRDQIKDNNLSEICHFCHIPLITKNYGSMLASKYDSYNFYSKKYPSIMEFELSNRCNLQCVMCNGFLSSTIRNEREKLPLMPIKYDEKFVQQLEEFIPHLKVAEFTGGDPLLIEIYYDIWEKIHELNPQCNILVTTNANTSNVRFENILLKNKNICFNISIDSLQKNTYESIRVGGNFEKAMKNITIFYEYCLKNNNTINFLVCPLRNNWKEFPDFVNYCNNLRISVYFHRVLKPYSQVLWTLSSKELFEIYNYLKSFDFTAKTSYEIINKNNYSSLISQIYTWYNESIEREKQKLTFEIPFINISDNEKTLYESIQSYFEYNYDIARDFYKEYKVICEKVHNTLNKLPSSIDKNEFFERFLCVPIDESIIQIFLTKSEDELLLMIENWMK